MNLSLTVGQRRLPLRLRMPGRTEAPTTSDGSSLMLVQLVSERRSENNFDLLRLIGALMVLFGHSFDLLGQTSR